VKSFLIAAFVAGLWIPAMEASGQMPAWYLETGLPATDTDGDGIPDAWELRTFGDPAVADSGLDRDGDGLTDLEEFSFGSDPRTYSTMADGWSDKEKRDAGLAAVFRVTPGVTAAQWREWLGWSAQTWQTLTATNTAGFVATYAEFVYNTAPYTEENGAADFWIVARTDRPAWLTVGDALATNSFPVRAGNSRVHIRAAYGGPVTVTLDPHPGTLAQTPGATNGLWLCGLSVEACRYNTVLFSDGDTPPPVPGAPDSVDGLLVLSPPPAASFHSLASPPPSVILQPLRMTAGSGALALGNGGWYCIPCGPGLCDWPDYAMIGCDAVSRSMNGVDGSDPILSAGDAWNIYQSHLPDIQCTVTQTVANSTYPFIYGKVIFSFRQCEAVGGFVFGAEMNWPLHEPACYEYTGCGGIGCMCQDVGNTYVGFDHGKVNTCFFDRHPDEPAADKEIHHCLGVVWDGQPIDLTSLCASYGLEYVSWEVNDTRQTSSVLEPGSEPSDLEPKIFHVKMLQASNPDIVWDQIFIVVNNRKTKTRYDKWVTQWSLPENRIWLRELPDAFVRLGSNNTDPEPNGTEWFAPKVPGKYYHHKSAWDMRSKITEHGHGNQACYDADGHIVTSGIAAGTPDYVGVGDGVDPGHVTYDVDPYVRALQLDGNPCRKDRTYLIIRGINLTHAVIYQGANTENYLLCRPPTEGVLLPETN